MTSAVLLLVAKKGSVKSETGVLRDIYSRAGSTDIVLLYEDGITVFLGRGPRLNEKSLTTNHYQKNSFTFCQNPGFRTENPVAAGLDLSC